MKSLQSNILKEASTLYDNVAKVSFEGNKELLSCRKDLCEFIESHETDFELEWSDDEIEEFTKHKHIGWEVIGSMIDKAILEKLMLKITKDKKFSSFRTVSERYKRVLKSAFERYQKDLNRLQKALLIESNSQQNYKDAAVPASLQISAIAATRFAPHIMMFTASTLGLILVGYAIYTEYQDWQVQKRRTNFEQEKREYLKKRAKETIDRLRRELSDDIRQLTRRKSCSDLYEKIFGESIRQQILNDLSMIIQSIPSTISKSALIARTRSGNEIAETSRNTTGGDKYSMFDDIYSHYIISFMVHNVRDDDLRDEIIISGEFGQRVLSLSDRQSIVSVKSNNQEGADIGTRLKLCQERFFRYQILS